MAGFVQGLRRGRGRGRREPTIALINIVFLMLVFFMIAGTLAPPLDPQLRLVRAADLDGREPPDTLVIHADGRLSLRGETLPDIAAFWQRLDAPARAAPVRIVPDRDLPAPDLVALARALRQAGAVRVVVVSERALP